MKRLAVLALTAGLAAGAHANTIPVSFSGVVSDPSLSGVSAPPTAPYADGQTLSGSFVYDTSTGTFTSFSIGPFTAPAGTTAAANSLAATPFEFVQSVVSDPATGNPTLQLTLDLESSSTFDTSNLAAFLLNPAGLLTDPTNYFDSTIDVFAINADGSTTTVDALLTSYVVPEPASALLLGPLFAGLAFVRRRQR